MQAAKSFRNLAVSEGFNINEKIEGGCRYLVFEEKGSGFRGVLCRGFRRARFTTSLACAWRIRCFHFAVE